MWALCPRFHHVTVVRAPHSWILCNCKGPLLNSVPGNLIFTAAPDRNHLAIRVGLYWNWKIATAVYCFKQPVQSVGFLVLWIMLWIKIFRKLLLPVEISVSSAGICPSSAVLKTLFILDWKKRCCLEVGGPLLVFLLHCFGFKRPAEPWRGRGPHDLTSLRSATPLKTPMSRP